MAAEKTRKIQIIKNIFKKIMPSFLLKVIRKIRISLKINKINFKNS